MFVPLVAAGLVFVALVLLVATRCWERVPDLWLHLSDFCGDCAVPREWCLRLDIELVRVQTTSKTLLLLLVLVRVAGVLLLVSGFLIAPAHRTWDYPNGYVGLPIGAFLVLLSLPSWLSLALHPAELFILQIFIPKYTLSMPVT